MDICAIAAVDKRLLAKKVGDDLAERHGRKPRRSVGDIEASARASGYRAVTRHAVEHRA